MMVYICAKFHENILNRITVMERTRKVNGWKDRPTDGGHDIIRPVFYGRMKTVYEWGGLPSHSDMFLVQPDKLDTKRH